MCKEKIFLRKYGFFIFCLIFFFSILCYFYFYNALILSKPIGYGGFYLQFSEQIYKNAFNLPFSIDYYGPGGTPASYPPYGFYFIAFLHAITGISFLDSARFVPPVFTVLSFGAVFIFFILLSKNKWVSLGGSFLLIFIPTFYEYHATAAGIIRAPALLFSLCSLIFFLLAISRIKYFLPLLCSGIFLGLAIGTHLSYALFIIIGLGAFTFFFPYSHMAIRKRLFIAAFIIIIGLIISSPWWVTIFSRFGGNVFLSASRTHGSFWFLHFLKSFSPKKIPSLFLSLSEWNWQPIYFIGFTFAGLFGLLFSHRWDIPAFFLFVYLFVGESERFLVLLGSFAFSLLIYFLFSQQVEGKNPFIYFLSRIISISLTIFILASVMIPPFSHSELENPPSSIGDDEISIGKWFQSYSDINATYLAFTNNDNINEFFPYLLKRSSVVGRWGAEWNNTYDQQIAIENEISRCYSQNLYSCLSSILQKSHLHPDYLIITKDYSFTDEMDFSIAWTKVDEIGHYSIFRKNAGE
jgi:hypothetical protein